jgi:PKD repeat protein
MARHNPGGTLRWYVGLPVVLSLIVLLLPAPAFAQNSPPVADAGESQSVFVDETVALTGTASDPDGNDILEWLWTLESSPEGSLPYFPYDDNASVGFIPDVAGDYVFSLVASDGIAWSDADYVTVSAADFLPPEAIVNADPITGPAPLTVAFDASASVDPQGAGLSYDWVFGDNSYFSTEVAPIHTYTQPGTYTAVLTVIDAWGQGHVDTVQIVVTAENAAPIAAPTATPNLGSAPLTVQFAANASDPEGDALSFVWDFGDGSTSTEEDPSHTFVDGGSYSVLLSVSDGINSIETSLPVMVEPGGELSVSQLRIRKHGKVSTRASVRLAADFSLPVPAPTDVLAMSLDGIPIFATSFAAFVAVGDDDETEQSDDAGGVYKLRADGLRVWLDLDNGTIRVDRRSFDASGLDESNGIDVQFSIGSASALQNVEAEYVGKRKLRFCRH